MTRILQTIDALATQPLPDVAPILHEVRTKGDAALERYNRELDAYAGAVPVPRDELEKAAASVPDALAHALLDAAAAVRRHHNALVPVPVTTRPRAGITCTVLWEPVARAGVYAPGGEHPYVSTLAMTIVPARVAGVPEVIVATPPRAPPALVGAAHLLGADAVYRVGGAQAIAAMAYGTTAIPRCDAVVGPGNAWVEAAKRAVAGTVRTDCPAGPSEVLVVAGPGVTAARVAAELVAQAEHGPATRVLATVPDEPLAHEVIAALAHAPAHARPALERGGILVRPLEEGLTIAEELAFEHVVVLGADASVERAGLTIHGPAASVAWTDYAAGPSHVLPTGGAARAFAGLGLETFLVRRTRVAITREVRAALATVETLAAAEGFPAHADAARRSLG